MYKEHPICKIPDEDTKLWRFMDFTKFYSLLDKKALHFTRTDQLDDKFEGSIPKSSQQLRFKQNFDLLKGIYPEIFITELQKRPPLLDEARRMSYICSFHISEEESAALWRIYLKSNEGVVIQTTIKNLISSLNFDDTYDVRLSSVKYIDYSHGTIPVERNILYPILHKRKSFEYEKEFRAFVFFPKDLCPGKMEPGVKIEYNSDNFPLGIFIPVDINSLLIEIRVAPTSHPWFKELVQSLVDKFDIKLTVKQSILDEEPLF
jgi:hypothetical protein